MTQITRVRSNIATRIARLDRQRFNEAVASGFYQCAPSTAIRSVRLFEEDDLVALFVFARLIDLGLPSRRAGDLACEFKSGIRDRGGNEVERVVYVRGMRNDCFMPADRYDPDHEKQGTEYPGLGPVVMSVDFNVSTIRRLIREGIEEERSILGREGEDD